MSGVETRSRRTGWTLVLVASVAAPLHDAAAEEGSAARNESSITVYGGDRFGGRVKDSTTDLSINLDNGASIGVALDIGLDQNTQLELFYSQQKTAITSGGSSSPVNSAGLTFHNYHIGGTNFIDQPGRGLYVMGGVGGTTVTPDEHGLNSQTFFSGNLGIGWMVPLGAHVGLRFEARGYGILLTNNVTVFCGGAAGCTIAIRGNALYEGEVSVGISARF